MKFNMMIVFSKPHQKALHFELRASFNERSLWKLEKLEFDEDIINEVVWKAAWAEFH